MALWPICLQFILVNLQVLCALHSHNCVHSVSTGCGSISGGTLVPFTGCQESEAIEGSKISSKLI